MFGVVLWSDEQEQKAVIWCEDHGDLAFYRDTDGDAGFEFDVGDWVQFDMTMDCHKRFAHDVRLVSEGVFLGLADALHPPRAQDSGDTPEISAVSTRPERETAQIIPFAFSQVLARKMESRVHANRA